ALEETTVDEDARVGRGHQVLGAGHGARAAEEGDLHVVPWSRPATACPRAGVRSIALVGWRTVLHVTTRAPAEARLSAAASAKIPCTATQIGGRMPALRRWPTVSRSVRPVETMSSTRT